MKYMILILNIKQTELLSLLPEMENEKKEKKSKGTISVPICIRLRLFISQKDK
jgi:hypothetical protein